jgi:hypothetical protein
MTPLQQCALIGTIIATSCTAALSIYRWQQSAYPRPAYIIISGSVSLKGDSGQLRADIVKRRPECTRKSAVIEFRFVDGSSKSFNVDFGSHLTPGRHVLAGSFEIKNTVAPDASVAPLLQTFHDCGADNPPVTAICQMSFEGSAKIVCDEED